MLNEYFVFTTISFMHNKHESKKKVRYLLMSAGVNEVRQTEMHTAEQLLNERSRF
jgi:hypothetical protein